MLPGYPGEHVTRAEPGGGIVLSVHSVLAVCATRIAWMPVDFSKQPRPSRCWRRAINISGVDFWHAVEFSRNGRFLWIPSRAFLRALPFGLAFPTLSDPRGPDFRRCDSVFRPLRGSDSIRSNFVR